MIMMNYLQSFFKGPINSLTIDVLATQQGKRRVKFGRINEEEEHRNEYRR